MEKLGSHPAGDLPGERGNNGTRMQLTTPSSNFSIVLMALLLGGAFASADSGAEFTERARAKHGEFGAKAAGFLVEHMPEADRSVLTADFLMENLDLAIKARETFVWAKDVPEEIFFNDVLPYAVFDEPRDPWRAEFFAKAGEMVKEARTASEAARILNRDFFKAIKTHYHVKRERVNQSPAESIRQGRATCTGLSIILVDACRAVGIPARAVGTPMWSNKNGNHTWVEIWDKEWHFTGADEYSPKGLNHGWFAGPAAKAKADNPIHSIYATSWKRDGGIFPMVWAPRSNAVAGINVTARYVGKSPGEGPSIGVRFFDGPERVVRRGWLLNESGERLAAFETKAGTADMNDTPRLPVVHGKRYRFVFEIDGNRMKTAPFVAGAGRGDIHDIRESDLTEVGSKNP